MEVKYFTRLGIRGEWQAGFTIGVQTFYLEENGDQQHADWYVEQLNTAFSNLLGKSVKATIESPLQELDSVLPKAEVTEDFHWSMPIDNTTPTKKDTDFSSCKYLGSIPPTREQILWAYERVIEDLDKRLGRLEKIIVAYELGTEKTTVGEYVAKKRPIDNDE